MLEIARIGKELEKYYGIPQDAEWAIDTDLPFPENVYMLQARPAHIAEQEAKPVLGTRTGIDFVRDFAKKGKLGRESLEV